jgi:hypothetical protein
MARAYPTIKAAPTEGVDPHLSRIHLGKVAPEWKQSIPARSCLSGNRSHWLGDGDTSL